MILIYHRYFSRKQVHALSLDWFCNHAIESEKKNKWRQKRKIPTGYNNKDNPYQCVGFLLVHKSNPLTIYPIL